MLSLADSRINHLNIVHFHISMSTVTLSWLALSLVWVWWAVLLWSSSQSLNTTLLNIKDKEHLIHSAARLVCTRLWSDGALTESKGMMGNIFTRDSFRIVFTFCRHRSTQLSKMQSTNSERVKSVKQNTVWHQCEWTDPSGKDFIQNAWWCS